MNVVYSVSLVNLEMLQQQMELFCKFSLKTVSYTIITTAVTYL